jgi:hypothetical protein
VLDFSSLLYVDLSAARAVEKIGYDAQHAGRMVYCSCINDKVTKVLSTLNPDHCLPTHGIFAEREDALRAAVAFVEGGGVMVDSSPGDEPLEQAR